MSNILLTTQCNKNCPYCFARKARDETKKSPHMDFELFKKIVQKHRGEESVQLLGGEPTSYPLFKEAVNYCIDQELPRVSIISNFLFKEDIRDFLCNILRTARNTGFSFLVNSTDLEVGNRFSIFINNYKSIREATSCRDNTDLSCGITLDYTKNKEYYALYLKHLFETLGIRNLRISIPHPGDDQVKNTFSIINNKEYGQLVIDVVNICVCLRVVPHLDCILFPCMFTEDDLEYLKQFLENLRFKCNENLGCPTDYFPDGSVSYCYPCERIRVQENKSNKSQHISHILSYKYRSYKLSLDYPQACNECSYFGNLCDGPCLGYFDFDTNL